MKNQILMIGVLLLGIGNTIAAELYVRPGESIQNAINNANAGDVIRLAKGTFVENITVPADKTGLTIRGEGANKTIIESDGGNLNPKFAPAGVPADIIVDVFAAGVSISKLTIRHPLGETDKRDIGVFFRPPAVNGSLAKSKIQRDRIGNLEPTVPGSRGIFVFRATGVTIEKNDFDGNYEDHIHLPTSGSKVMNNEVEDATRLGIAVIQETDTSLSVDTVIMGNEVSGSGSDGIQIQGDNNTVVKNEVEENQGAGIRLCGPASIPACVAPGGTATASDNVVAKNELEDNAGGNILDFGSNNIVSNNDSD